ncbi:hypothetical protein LTR56_017061 [Elasticomyces elasticus]|nr:hypothetical protein LTR56_017061 [Elasticomyces elasticus]KAK3643809.1 hypothetical protein LTR22_015546 [Elasticomyces elasticus]KAK4912671.1 hypothetical protein LTR49_018940 [Elasticomyces elasticus]KAK5752107.1 hypothetical protein LTS12_017786 [Elasticomyces elasticus]
MADFNIQTMSTTKQDGSATPILSILDLPDELILHIHRTANGDDHQSRTVYIPANPKLTITPLSAANAFSLVCQHFWSIIRTEYVSTTNFQYVSPGSSIRTGRWHPSAAQDLLSWLQRFREGDVLKKLHLEMYASEFLWLFAPTEASKLLDMPSPEERHSWTEAAHALKQLQFNELKIVMLDHGCPRPCENGQMAGGWRDTIDGSPPRHFIPDHRWTVKAISEAMSHLNASIIHLIRNGERMSPGEADMMAGCSWTMLHSSSLFHSCDSLSYASHYEQFWADMRDGKVMYQVPVVWKDCWRLSGEKSREMIELDMGSALDRLFGELP